jgi:uncharacterized coiled-coil protein SlyX
VPLFICSEYGCQVNEQEEDPEKLSQLLARKRQEIKRLEEQLQARYPRGRACTEEEAQERVRRAISLPEHPGLMFALYLSVALLCAPTPLPSAVYLDLAVENNLSIRRSEAPF